MGWVQGYSETVSYPDCMDGLGTRLQWNSLISRLYGWVGYKATVKQSHTQTVWMGWVQGYSETVSYPDCMDGLGTRLQWNSLIPRLYGWAGYKATVKQSHTQTVWMGWVQGYSETTSYLDCGWLGIKHLHLMWNSLCMRAGGPSDVVRWCTPQLSTLASFDISMYRTS